MPTEVAVISVAGREPLTEQTVNALATRGGLIESGLCGRVYWFGDVSGLRFDGWKVSLSAQIKPVSFELLRVFEGCAPGNDLLFLEDDVIPCRNAIIAAANVPFPNGAGLISFYDYRNELSHPGMFKAERRTLMGSQAVKFPAFAMPELTRRLREKAESDREAKRVKAWQVGWDTWMGLAMEAMGLDVWHYAPSLFQHGGAKWSVANEGSRHFYAKNFPGQDWDALTECPDPIPSGHFDEFFKECRFHKTVHPGGAICKYWPITHKKVEGRA